MNLIRGAIRPSFRVGHSSLEVCTPKSLLVHGWLLKATPADVKSNPRVMRRMKSDQSRAWVRLSDFRIGPSRHHHGSAPLTSVRDICLGFIICTSPASRSPNRHGVSVSVTGVTMSVLWRSPQYVQTQRGFCDSSRSLFKDNPPCQAWAFEGGALELHGALGIKFH